MKKLFKDLLYENIIKCESVWFLLSLIYLVFIILILMKIFMPFWDIREIILNNTSNDIVYLILFHAKIFIHLAFFVSTFAFVILCVLYLVKIYIENKKDCNDLFKVIIGFKNFYLLFSSFELVFILISWLFDRNFFSVYCNQHSPILKIISFIFLLPSILFAFKSVINRFFTFHFKDEDFIQ